MTTMTTKAGSRAMQATRAARATTRAMAGPLMLVALAVIPAAQSRADVLTFASRSAFDAGTSGITTETFQAGRLTGVNFVGPINASTTRLDLAGNLVFAAGDLAAGASYNSIPERTTSLRLVEIGGVAGNVGLRTPNMQQRLELTFDAPVTAVGFDLYVTPVVSFATIRVYAAGDIAIGIVQPNGVNPNTPTFVNFAVTGATSPIAKIVIEDNPNLVLVPTIDDVSFGSLVDATNAGPLAPVPEPGTLAMCGLGLGMASVAGLGARRVTRRHRAR